jgi:hypothetical protein
MRDTAPETWAAMFRAYVAGEAEHLTDLAPRFSVLHSAATERARQEHWWEYREAMRAPGPETIACWAWAAQRCANRFAGREPPAYFPPLPPPGDARAALEAWIKVCKEEPGKTSELARGPVVDLAAYRRARDGASPDGGA